MNTEQVSVPRTPTSSLYEAPDSSAASLDESSESSFHPVVPQHKTSSPFIPDDDHPRRRSPSRVYLYIHIYVFHSLSLSFTGTMTFADKFLFCFYDVYVCLLV
jgi:hypothetical protein